MDDRLKDNSFKLLIVYIFFGWVFSHTIIANPLAVYASFTILAVLFSFLFLQHERISSVSICKEQAVWIPYLSYTIIGFGVQGKFEYLIYWAVCLIIVLLSTNINLMDIELGVLLKKIGIFIGIGVAVQLLAPALYYSYIVQFFTDSDIIKLWGVNYGLAGFTYQLDTTALPILYAEGAFLSFLKTEKSSDKSQVQKYIVVFICILAVFFTGKRMLLLLSIIVPILLVVSSQKNTSKKMFLIVGLSLLIILGYSFLMNNIQKLYDVPYMNRIAKTLSSFSSSEDITSGRSDLANLAKSAYEDHPYGGIGVGRFRDYTHAYTDVHNTYLQVLCEQGIVGIVLFCLPLLSTLISTLRLLRKENGIKESVALPYIKLALFIQLVYIFYAFTGNVNINLTGYMMYFLAISFMYSSVRFDNKSNRRKTENTVD